MVIGKVITLSDFNCTCLNVKIIFFSLLFTDVSSENRGVSHLWSSASHVAIVVSDVGRSLSFYTDVVGMKQVLRPDFDR
jgi:hypothetical protein